MEDWKMIKPQHRAEAEAIGADSWRLLNFSQLPDNASRERQLDALRADKKWQEDHMNEIGRRISALIHDVFWLK